MIGCVGGGSNFAGLTFPFLGRNFREGAKYRVIAVEPEAAPSLTRGVYAYDFGDTGKMAPLVKMHTLGHDFIPEPIHAGGLRYHGMAPLVSLLKEHDYIEARSVHQRATFEAGVQFARAEGILPAPESTHAIRVAIDEALPARERARPASSCSTCAATATSTCRRTSATWPARSRTTSTRSSGSRRPWPACRRSDGSRASAKTRLLVVRTADLHRRTARVAVRRGASLPALRRPPPRRSSDARASSDDAPPEPAVRSRPARGQGERRAADRRADRRRTTGSTSSGYGGRRPRGGRRHRAADPDTAAAGGCDTRRHARRVPRFRAHRRFDRPRGPGEPGDAGWTMSAWSPSGRGPGQAVADGTIDRADRDARRACRRRPGRARRPAVACLAALDDLAGPWRGSLAPLAVITDVASTKGALLERADAAGLRFVGGHPMAGREVDRLRRRARRPVRRSPVGRRARRIGRTGRRRSSRGAGRGLRRPARPDGRGDARSGRRRDQPPAAGRRGGARRGGRRRGTGARRDDWPWPPASPPAAGAT